MESEWRFNIPFYGMVGADWELCARFVPPNPAIQYLLVKRGLYADPEVWVSFSESVPDFLFVLPPLAPNFPYGYEVEPDNI